MLKCEVVFAEPLVSARTRTPKYGFSILFRDFQLAEIAFFLTQNLKPKTQNLPEPGFVQALGGCPSIAIFTKIKACAKNYRRHIVDIPRIIF